MEIIQEIFNETFWYVAPILVALSTALSGVINQGFKISSSTWKQLISWLIGSSISCGAIALGFLGDDIGILSYITLSIVVGLSSNGIYDISIIRDFIDKWFKKGTETYIIKR